MIKGKWNVIIRTQGKNNDKELKNALYSVIAQDYKDKSIILIIHSDNETIIKKTTKFLEHFNNLIEMRIVIARKRQGVRAYPLNIALRHIDGEYISFLDHDDIYYPYMGKLLITQLEKTGKTFAFGESIEAIQEEVKDFSGLKYLYTKHKRRREKTSFNKILLFLDNFIPFNTFIIKSSLIGNTRFDERLEFLEDWDFLRKMCIKSNFSFVQIDRPVSEYRKRNDKTDTYNKKNIKRWYKAREITDANFQNKEITILIEEILSFKESLLQELNDLNYLVNMQKTNTGYRIWEGIKRIKILEKTIIRLIREIRHIVKD